MIDNCSDNDLWKPHKISLLYGLTHWGRVTRICVIKLTIIGSDNGLSPGQRQAIIWINDGMLLIWPLRTQFSEILIKIHIFSFMKMLLKMSFGKKGDHFSRHQCVNSMLLSLVSILFWHTMCRNRMFTITMCPYGVIIWNVPRGVMWLKRP